MSDDSRDATPMEAGIVPCAMSASRPPAALPSISEEMAPTSRGMSPTPSPLRVMTLAPLLNRENVKAILGLSGARSINIRVTFEDGRTDSKVISLAEGGSLALLLLDDNPDKIPSGAFCDIRPG